MAQGLQIGLTSGETLRVDLKQPTGWCGACRRALAADEARLTIDALRRGKTVRFAICRACLGEHAPELLAEMERMPVQS